MTKVKRSDTGTEKQKSGWIKPLCICLCVRKRKREGKRKIIKSKLFQSKQSPELSRIEM